MTQKETKLYIVRHGKTMFNTIGRAQGWSDSPLTVAGERGVREAGAGLNAEEGLEFAAAFTSDSGRTIATMDLIMEEIGMPHIPRLKDKRIREWCFGSLDGGYDGELFDGVLPRTDAYKQYSDLDDLTLKDIADGLMEVDTANWAQPWDVIKERIQDGFEDIAHSIYTQGGGNALVVSHGMTIGTFLWLQDQESPRPRGLDNGSVSIVSYDGVGFSVETIGDMGYRRIGKEILDKRDGE
jgi:probable phosphoglycerate mutase